MDHGFVWRHGLFEVSSGESVKVQQMWVVNMQSGHLGNGLIPKETVGSQDDVLLRPV